jgi:hypothetical protein
MALEVVADAEATGGKALKIGPGSALVQHSFVSFDAVADANRADFEVLVRSRATSNNATGQNLCGAAGRVFTTSTSSSGFNGYTAGRRYTGWRDRLISTVSGGTTTTLGTTAGTTVAAEVYAFGRFRVSGTTLQYRSWSGALEDEPATWEVETTNSTHSGAGWVGIWRNLLTNDVHVDFVGVGTGGDPAPSGPVGGGSTLYSALFDTLCGPSRLATVGTDSRAAASLATLRTADVLAMVSAAHGTQHDSRLGAARVAVRDSDSLLAASSDAQAVADSGAVVSREDNRATDSRASVCEAGVWTIDSHAAVAAIVSRLTDTAVAVTELVSEVRQFDSRVDVATLPARLIDTIAAASQSESRHVDIAAKVTALESRLVDTSAAVSGLLAEVRRFDTRMAVDVLAISEVDLRAAVSLAEQRLNETLTAVAATITAVHDSSLSVAELEARVWDTLATVADAADAISGVVRVVFSGGSPSVEFAGKTPGITFH